MTDSVFHDSVLAELAAQNMAIIKALSGLAALAGDRDEYKRALLDAGIRDLQLTEFWSVPVERRGAFLAQIEARSASLIAGVR